MATRAVILNLTLTCYVNNTTILQHGDLRGNFKHNFELCYLNKATIFKYGGLAYYLNYFNKTTMLQYGYNFIRHSKEVAKAVRQQTHN